MVSHSSPDPDVAEAADLSAEPKPSPPKPRETGGRGGPEPTRYGDWENNGRCIDF